MDPRTRDFSSQTTPAPPSAARWKPAAHPLERQVIHAVIAIEIRQRNRARAIGALEIDFSLVDHHRRCHISGNAAKQRFPRRDMANVAFVLETEIVALAPPLGLVVEQAARIEAEAAADSAVGAMVGPATDAAA